MAKHIPHPLFCLCCGRKANYLIDGKYCSDECANAGFDIMQFDKLFCNNCGKEFMAISKANRFCPECVHTIKKCLCFYPRKLNYYRLDKERIPESLNNVKMVYVGNNHSDKLSVSCVPDPLEDTLPNTISDVGQSDSVNAITGGRKRKKNRPRKDINKWSESELLRFGSVTELTVLARKRGFDSYGKFVAYLNSVIEKG